MIFSSNTDVLDIIFQLSLRDTCFMTTGESSVKCFKPEQTPNLCQPGNILTVQTLKQLHSFTLTSGQALRSYDLPVEMYFLCIEYNFEIPYLVYHRETVGR